MNPAEIVADCLGVIGTPFVGWFIINSEDPPAMKIIGLMVLAGLFSGCWQRLKAPAKQ